MDIVYEDDSVLVINKPPNMATIPSREHQTGTLANAIVHYYNEQQIPSTIHIVTRLDRDTSGLLLVAKNRFVHHLLAKQQQSKSVSRTYLALVHGVMEEEAGTINAPIGRKSTSIIEREVREDGQEAITHFAVKERMIDCTLVQLELETGRTHQIRVHLAHLGHPLMGDDLYGGLRSRIGRQALHSKELRFYHPFLEKEMVFVSDIPGDMSKVGSC